MKIIIRADASQNIGSGHVMRCLTLAEALSKAEDTTVEFITRQHSGNLDDLIKKKGFAVHSLPIFNKDTEQRLEGYEQWLGFPQEQDADDTIQDITGKKIDWIIIDHYALDHNWENKLRPYAKNIMVIDDLANRKHDCDLLLDQTYGREVIDYQPLVPEDCDLLLGSYNALLRPDFKKLRLSALKRREQHNSVKRIMVSMGSMDEANITPKVIEALTSIDWEIKPTIDVVLTSGAQHIATVKEIAATTQLTVNLLVDVSNMADLMQKSDLAIGSGGTTSWERCCMALPTILIILAENQKKIGENLALAGVTITFSEDDEMQNNISQAVETLMQDKSRYIEMSRNASTICDGNGAKRTAEKILSISLGENSVI